MQVRDTEVVARPEQAIASPESLTELIEAFQGLTTVPSVETIAQWFASVSLRQRDCSQFRLFSDRNYARNLVIRTPFAELLFLCWRPGQRTPIHDHGGSIGVVMVCEGMMTETMFETAPEGHVRPYHTYRRTVGAITAADVPDIHQLLNLESEGNDLVTLHCYAPPLSVLNTYSQSSSKVHHWREMYFSGGAGI